MDRNELKEIFAEVISEMVVKGLMRDFEEIAVAESSEMLGRYYSGEVSLCVSDAIKKARKDKYGAIIPMYFRDKKTVEQIAEFYNVEPSTISRNKKRLCLTIYKNVKQNN